MSDPEPSLEPGNHHGFPIRLWRGLDRHPPPGLKWLGRFRSPLRGPWLTSVFGLVLLVTLPIVIITGLLSYIAYAPQFGQAIPGDVGWLRLPAFSWPTRPSWLYRLTQGLHVGLGLLIIPVVLAKLWSVIPRLFVWPPARSIAQLLERLSVLMLVGGILFEIVTGVLNIQYDYIFGFSFYTGHYFGAWVFITGFLMHIAVKIPRMITGLRSLPMREVLRTNVTDTRPQPRDPDGLVAANPARTDDEQARCAGAWSAAGVLLHRCADGRADPRRHHPQCRPAAAAGPTPQSAATSRSTRPPSPPGSRPRASVRNWRLVLRGGPSEVVLDRATLAGMPQHTARLPIACVEGWSTVQTWSGVRLAELARIAGRACAALGAGDVAAARRCLRRGHAAGQSGRRSRCAAGAAGQRCRPVAGSRLSGPDHRPRPARCAQHQVGRRPSNSRRAEMSRILKTFQELVRFSSAASVDHGVRLRAVGLHTGHLQRRQTLWNPGTWWQSIAVWFAAAVVGHDLVLFPLYALVDRILSTRLGRRSPGDSATFQKSRRATTFVYRRWEPD